VAARKGQWRIQNLTNQPHDLGNSGWIIFHFQKLKIERFGGVGLTLIEGENHSDVGMHSLMGTHSTCPHRVIPETLRVKRLL